MRKSTIRIAGLCLIGSACAFATIVSSSAIYACTGPCNAKSTSASLVAVANVSQLTDSEIAYIYVQANQFDVEETELGIARGTASGVKQHGEMVARDHRGVVVAFQGLLAANNITPVAPPGNSATVEQHQAIIGNLKARTGVDFDREYLTQAIIGHREFISLVSETLPPAAGNPALASHLKEVLPAFRHHLSMTMAAAKALDSDGD